MREGILVFDQGTTGTRAILYARRGRIIGQFYRPIRQHYPKPGWVEHDPEEIWRSCLECAKGAIGGKDIRLAAIGITNQRETTIVWDRKTGVPISRAIVWQDRRTAPECEALKRQGAEALVRRASGLLLDPYFSGTKLAWLLRNVPGARAAAKGGRLAFGTVDAWLIWKLTGGHVHATDPTNASRTMLLNLDRRDWDPALLRLLEVPRCMLPEVRPSAGHFGKTIRQGELPAGIPIAGVAGDQQAALFGQGCVRPGDIKVTYGTGAFLLLQTGKRLVRSSHGLLTTLACGPDGKATGALEGSVFIAGAVVQWLRDELKILKDAAESEEIARSVPHTAGVYLVPAFAGLGAPWWDARARGTVTGLTRGSGRAHIVRAALEGIAFQVADVVRAMESSTGKRVRSLRVDGGAAANGFLMQFQSDILNARLARPKLIETTAVGAASLAGLGSGFWSRTDIGSLQTADRTFRPAMTSLRRRELLEGWHGAVSRTRSNSSRGSRT